MANRYWVGGTGSWSDATNHWATSSGGGGGVGNLPTISDDVFIDSSSGFSGGGTLTLDINDPYCKNFTCTSGHTYTITTSAAIPDLIPYGSMTLEAGITMTGINLSFSGSGTGRTFTSAGVTQVAVYIYNGGISLGSNLTCTSYVVVYGGTFSAGSYNVTTNTVDCTGASGATINLGSGTWTITGAANCWNLPYTGITVNGNTSTIKFTGAGTKTFTGGNQTYNNVWFADSGTINIADSNTYNIFRVDSPPRTIKFGNSTITTLTTFNVVGTVGNVMTLNSVGGVLQWTISKPSGTVVCDYLNLSNSNAIGGALWYAGSHSTNTLNNSGWLFWDIEDLEVPYPGYVEIIDV
jgi:hypothetical protein